MGDTFLPQIKTALRNNLSRKAKIYQVEIRSLSHIDYSQQRAAAQVSFVSPRIRKNIVNLQRKNDAQFISRIVLAQHARSIERKVPFVQADEKLKLSGRTLSPISVARNKNKSGTSADLEAEEKLLFPDIHKTPSPVREENTV